MYFKNYNGTITYLDISKYHTNYDMYYQLIKQKFNKTIPKTSCVTKATILDYLKDNKKLLSL